MSVYHYRSQPTEEGFFLECLEMDLAAEGGTLRDAERELKRAIVERLTRVEAVAPPSKRPRVEVELEALEEPVVSRPREPQGPGEASGMRSG